MKFPVTKYGLLRLLPLVFDVEPPAAAKITYFRGEASARLQWDKRGVFSAYRFDFRNGQFWAAQTICVNDRVTRRERPVSAPVLRAAGLYAAAGAAEREAET